MQLFVYLFARHSAPQLQHRRSHNLELSEFLSLQLFECVPAMTLFIVITRRTISIRRSSPLNTFLLAF